MAAPSPDIAGAESLSSGRGRGPAEGREGEGAVPPADDPGIDIGGRLRRLREEHGLSQRELARRAGVSNATVSLIEQNRASPSIGSLKRVLDGLPLSLAAFFALPEGPEDPVFFPAAELTEIAGRAGGHAAGGELISYRQVGCDLSGRALQILHERLAPGADTGPTALSHAGEEGGVVIRGRVELTVGPRRRILGPGDAYYFQSRLPHRFRVVGEEPAEIVSACTPPSF
ncbi:cupin domain-containing protein [Mycobacterium sp. KBS0706]|nr:cupin domain-containing protein [Mycobacterium sp. KBS0706]TSD87475.1 cupin domain-containing protein [Mycobacterium sp. KBS0706]